MGVQALPDDALVFLESNGLLNNLASTKAKSMANKEAKARKAGIEALPPGLLMHLGPSKHVQEQR